jgi:hypothetical protein
VVKKIDVIELGAQWTKAGSLNTILFYEEKKILNEGVHGLTWTIRIVINEVKIVNITGQKVNWNCRGGIFYV